MRCWSYTYGGSTLEIVVLVYFLLAFVRCSPILIPFLLSPISLLQCFDRSARRNVRGTDFRRQEGCAERSTAARAKPQACHLVRRQRPAAGGDGRHGSQAGYNRRLRRLSPSSGMLANVLPAVYAEVLGGVIEALAPLHSAYQKAG